MGSMLILYEILAVDHFESIPIARKVLFSNRQFKIKITLTNLRETHSATDHFFRKIMVCSPGMSCQ